MSMSNFFMAEFGGMIGEDTPIGWINDRMVTFVFPRRPEDDERLQCRLVMANMMTVPILKLPKDREAWAKREW